MNNRRQRRTYDKEIKTEAVRLVLEDGYSAAEVERKLGKSNGVTHLFFFEIRRKEGLG